MREFGRDLRAWPAELRYQFAKRPWSVLGVATVVGGAVALVLVPPRGRSLMRRVAGLASARSLAGAGEATSVPATWALTWQLVQALVAWYLRRSLAAPSTAETEPPPPAEASHGDESALESAG